MTPLNRPWKPALPLLLASGSATRRQLLEAAGLDVETCPSHLDERALEARHGSRTPSQKASGLAAAKADSVASLRPGRIVLGADQILDLDGEIFHKPRDLAAARAQLASLAGRTHRLHSAVALVDADGSVETFVETARLTMRPLDDEAVAAYVALAGEERVTSSVGGYQLEGLGIHLFETIDGDHTTILGLPMIPLLARLRRKGLLAF